MNLHDLPARNAPPDARPLSAPSAARDAEAVWSGLWRAAAARYRPAGQFAWHFARGKLRHDPVFRALLTRGDIRPGARVLDIGCGQGLLASLLASCEDAAARGRWPAAWPPAPTGTHYIGIELMARDVARATAALQGLPRRPQVQAGDMRRVDFARCDVVVILDVLHYVGVPEQDAVLARVHDALVPGGRLLLRVGDAAHGWRHALTRWVDLAVTLGRGHREPPIAWRRLPQWIAALRERGFGVQALPMYEGTPFANVLLVCTKTAETPR